MPYQSWSVSRPRPRTNVGLWLQAVFLRQHARRDELRDTLNRGVDGWNYDEPAVVQAVFETVMRRLFGRDRDDQAIAEFAGKVRAVMDGEPEVDQGTAEALIQTALGDPGADAGINPGQRYVLQALLAGCGVFIMGITDEATVNEIIAEGERVAFEQGWKPPLARVPAARRRLFGRVGPQGGQGWPPPWRTGLPVYTRNAADFDRIDGLRVVPVTLPQQAPG